MVGAGNRQSHKKERTEYEERARAIQGTRGAEHVITSYRARGVAASTTRDSDGNGEMSAKTNGTKGALDS